MIVGLLDNFKKNKIMLVSTVNNKVIGDIHYYETINKLMKFVVDQKDNNILIRELSLEELNEALNNLILRFRSMIK